MPRVGWKSNIYIKITYHNISKFLYEQGIVKGPDIHPALPQSDRNYIE
jgi:hypothetical protein